MRYIARFILIAVMLYLSALALMLVHESGHVLHAWLSGGRVAAVHFGFFEFSRTELSFDPHPQFVAWGGPLWGCLLPLAAFFVMSIGQFRISRFLCFFAGLCLVVNGAYIGVGWMDNAGDAGTLLRHGAPPWTMCVAGLAAIAGGLYLWHRMGLRRQGVKNRE
jgi:hypothetical protein